MFPKTSDFKFSDQYRKEWLELQSCPKNSGNVQNAKKMISSEVVTYQVDFFR